MAEKQVKVVKLDKNAMEIDYHNVIIVLPNGISFNCRSTYGSEGDTINAEVDTETHPAWHGEVGQINEKGTNISKFRKKVNSINAGAAFASSFVPSAPLQSAKKSDAKSENAPHEDNKGN